MAMFFKFEENDTICGQYLAYICSNEGNQVENFEKLSVNVKMSSSSLSHTITKWG